MVVVIMGFVEKALTHVDGLAIFRLLRMLRVLKLTKSLPNLRAIITALIEALGSVGYVILLIALFNFIMACLGMVIFSKNDPFHFGTLTKVFCWAVCCHHFHLSRRLATTPSES